MIIHDFLLAQNILDIFEKRLQWKGQRRSQYFLRKYRKFDTIVLKNTLIIHQFVLPQKDLDIFEKRS